MRRAPVPIDRPFLSQYVQEAVAVGFTHELEPLAQILHRILEPAVGARIISELAVDRLKLFRAPDVRYNRIELAAVLYYSDVSNQFINILRCSGGNSGSIEVVESLVNSRPLPPDHAPRYAGLKQGIGHKVQVVAQFVG